MEIMLIDSAAGIGCPVIASVAGSDYAIAVTEPTPSGISDLKRALKVAEHFRIKQGIIINKHDINPEKTKEIQDYATRKGMDIISHMPYDERFVDALVKMKPIIEINEYGKLFLEMAYNVLRNIT